MNFLNPTFYDVADITDDMPNKHLLIELYEEMNAQNERLWMFFEEIDEDPQHKVMKTAFIKPRQHRRKAKKRKAIETLKIKRRISALEQADGSIAEYLRTVISSWLSSRYLDFAALPIERTSCSKRSCSMR